MLNQFFNQTTTLMRQALQTCLCVVVMLGWTTGYVGLTEAQQVRFARAANFDSSSEGGFSDRVANLEDRLERVGPSSSPPAVSKW
jgi:hypothetical protein